MAWLHPWAWIGIGTLAIPLLVHLLAQKRARVRRIATLRFLEATPPASTRPSRITDPLLLLVRLLVLAVAVAALARPTVPASPPAILGQESPLTRVILIDAGPGMTRFTPEGETALDAARRRAMEEAASGAARVPEAGPGGWVASGPAQAGETYLLEIPGSGGSLGAAAMGAAAFLAPVPGRREIRVHSVVGVGTLPSEAMWRKLHGIPLVFEQIPLAPPPPDTVTIRHWASETRISLLSVGDGVQVVWNRTEAPPESIDSLQGAGPAYLAAEIARFPTSEPGFPATLWLGEGLMPGPGPGSGVEEGAGASPRVAGPTGWGGTPDRVGDLVLALTRDPVLGAAARAAKPDTTAGLSGPRRDEGSAAASVAIRTGSGEVAILVRPTRFDEDPGVHIAAVSGPEAFLSAALVGAVGRASHGGQALREMDPRIQPAEEVRRWNDRFGGEGTTAEDEQGGEEGRVEELDPAQGTVEARLLWGLVLLLLTVEWRLRRGSGVQPGVQAGARSGPRPGGDR